MRIRNKGVWEHRAQSRERKDFEPELRRLQNAVFRAQARIGYNYHVIQKIQEQFIDMNDQTYTPRPEHKFTFGLWTVGNLGRDPFGDATRPSLSPIKMVKELSRLGDYEVNLHDNDLVRVDAWTEERNRIGRELKHHLDDHGRKRP